MHRVEERTFRDFEELYNFIAAEEAKGWQTILVLAAGKDFFGRIFIIILKEMIDG